MTSNMIDNQAPAEEFYRILQITDEKDTWRKTMARIESNPRLRYTRFAKLLYIEGGIERRIWD